MTTTLDPDFPEFTGRELYLMRISWSVARDRDYKTLSEWLNDVAADAATVSMILDYEADQLSSQVVAKIKDSP